MTKHGATGTRLYNIWIGMRKRCFSVNHNDYKNYGARGISICKEWDNFNTFKEWAMNNGYKDNLTIDRIDVNGNYEPNNCRWITNKEQQHNKRGNHLITYNNETHTIAEWEQKLGFKKATIKDRLKLGWTIEKALTTPIKTRNNVKYKQYIVNGVQYSLRELCLLYNIPETSFRNKLNKGHTVEQIIDMYN